MSCLDKCLVTQRGGMQGHYKYTDGFSDSSSVGSVMDDTDREVCSLTDRAFKSLSIGDDALYNDCEFASSPIERYDAFPLDTQFTDTLRFNGQKVLSLGRKQNGGGAASAGEATVGATFQRSVLDMARKGLKNGAIETAWKQSRSKIISSGGSTNADNLERGQVRAIKDFKYKNSSNDLWENSALWNIRGEPSDYIGHFKPVNNHLHSYGDATAKTSKKDPEKTAGKSSKDKHDKSNSPTRLSDKNFFLHSEHSPFESWRDSNRILLEQNHTPDLISTNQRPMWYDSPLYKELRAEHGLQISLPEEHELNQTKPVDTKVSPALPSTSTGSPSAPQTAPPSSVVLQKAMAIEKKSESGSDASIPPWKKNMGHTMVAVPWSRPSIAFPSGEKERYSDTEAATEAILILPTTSTTILTPMTPVTMLRPNTLVTMAGPVTSATMLAPVTSVTTATSMKPATMLTPITPVTFTTPITSAAKLTPVTPVTMTTPTTSVKMATPITPVTMATPMISATMHTAITPFSTATPSIPVTLVNPVIAVTSVNEPTSSASTPFNISQLLTPIISTRQGTGTSEVMQSAFTPSSLDLDRSRSSSDASAKSISEVKSRNSYKAIASGLLFNLKDNRKRVKSTYSPTKFKTTELSKQPSKPETDEPKNASAISEAPVAEANVPLQPKASNVRPASEVVQESTDAQIVNHKNPADGGVSDDYLTLSSPHTVKEAAAYRNFNSTQENTQGKIQHAEASQQCVLKQSKSEKARPCNLQGMSLRSRNPHKAEGVTENVVPAPDKTVNSTGDKNNRDCGIKETQSGGERLFIRSGEDILNDIDIRSRDTYQDEEQKHSNRTEKQGRKPKEKSHLKPGLSVKEKVELFSVERNPPKSLFVIHKRDGAKLDRPCTKDKTLPDSKERENMQQSHTRKQEEQHAGKEGLTNQAFSARQNQYVKNERCTIKDDQESDRADSDKEPIAKRCNRLISTSDISENAGHQNLQQGDLCQRDKHVAGVPEGLKSYSDVELWRDDELVKNDVFANSKNGSAQQEVPEKGRLGGEDVFFGKQEDSERVLPTTQENLHKTNSSVSSAERLQPTEDTSLINERASENETFTMTENKVERKEVREDLCENREGKSSPKRTEEGLYSLDEKDAVKTNSNAEINKHLTARDRSASVDKDQKEHWNGIKENQPAAEDHVFANTDWAATEPEVPMKECSRSDILEEQERARSEVRDFQYADKVEKKQAEERYREQTSTGVNETEQNEQEKSTLIKEKMDYKGKYKSDSGCKEKDWKMKQILKLKDKVKDLFSIRADDSQEEVAEKHDKQLAKQKATQKEQIQCSPHSNIHTNKIKQQGYEIVLEERMEPEPDISNEIQESRQAVMKDSTMEVNTEQTVKASHKQRPVPPVPLKPKITIERQPSYSDVSVEFSTDLENGKTEVEEIEAHPALVEETLEETTEAENTIVPETKDTSETLPLQYYAINDGESEIDMRLIASPVSTLYTEASTTSSNDMDDGGWVRCLIESAKSQTPAPRSNASSPFPSRHTLFKVKDNTVRTSPLTKIIKSPLHRVPEEFRLGSPRDSWSGSEKGEEERRVRVRSRVHSPREASVSRASSSLRETPVRSLMLQPKISPVAQEHRSPQASPQTLALKDPPAEQVEGCMPINVSSGEVESNAVDVVDRVGENVTTSPQISFEHTEETEGSKETSEKSESTAEVQPLGKPPPVLPKTEKALRRAKRLTNKRMKKAEAENKPEGNSQSSRNPARGRRTEPPPPPQAETVPLRPAHNPPQVPLPHPEPGQTHAVPQSFPVTQRKLLQDPESGQYFMVDMPVQVKTKMFFDPETGKYIQLPVQAPEVIAPRTPSIEMLSSPYLLYPGFVPVPISSLPPQGLASQMLATETLTEDQSRNALSRQEDYQQIESKEANTHVEPAFVPYDCFPEETLYMEDEDSIHSRIMNSVSASELDSFAVGNL